MKSVIVVGAGIVGASIAWHLAGEGARVTLIDGGEPGGVATRASWAWINASSGNPEPYVRLRMAAMEGWRRLAEALPGLPVAWPGGLLWDLGADALDAYAREHAAWGYPLRVVGRDEAARIEPALANPPDRAVHVASEGVVDAVQATVLLTEDAGRHGTKIVSGSKVSSVVLTAGRAVGVETSEGLVEADAVVIAAGEATPGLLASAGAALPLDAPPGLLVVTRPAPPMLNGLVMAPELHVRQDPAGRLIAGADFGGTDPGEDAEATARAVFDTLRGMLRAGDRLAYDHHTIGRRPTPADGFPVVGAVTGVPGLWTAVTHSGVTLAPAIGAMLAAEMLGRGRDPLLGPYGHDRFG